MNKDKELINEQLKKFKLLTEYTFYVPKSDNTLDEADNEEPEGNLEPVDDANTDDVDADVDKVGDELGVDTNNDENPDLNDMGDQGTEEMPDLNADNTEMPAEEQPVPDETMNAPMEDEVELDVTQLVQGNEEAKQISAQNGQKIDQLLNKYNELESKLSKMDAISAKVDNLDKEIEKRIPTPAEKLEMRSLNSYPYSLKLTDYWAEKEGAYDVMGNDEKKEKVYTLTKDDVNSGFSDHSIKNSFNVDDNEFEEEEI